MRWQFFVGTYTNLDDRLSHGEAQHPSSASLATELLDRFVEIDSF